MSRQGKSHARYSPDIVIFLSLALLSIGVVMVFSASFRKRQDHIKDVYYFLKRQLHGQALAYWQ